MTRLEDLTADANVNGITGSSPVTIVATKWHGNSDCYIYT